MYKPQYLNVTREKKTAYGNNIAYFTRMLVKKGGFKWDIPEKKLNKSGRHFLGKIK